MRRIPRRPRHYFLSFPAHYIDEVAPTPEQEEIMDEEEQSYIASTSGPQLRLDEHEEETGRTSSIHGITFSPEALILIISLGLTFSLWSGITILRTNGESSRHKYLL